MAGLVPAIHVFFRAHDRKTWMPGPMGLCLGRRSRTRVPGMTKTLEHFDAFDIVVVPFPQRALVLRR
jgi:hypothetical protein